MTLIPFSSGTAEAVTRDALPSAAWERTFRNEGKDSRFYEIIEQTLANAFEYRYLLLRDNAGVIRGIQPLVIVQQNLVEGIPGSARRVIEGIRRRVPRFLTMRLLMAGCAAGAGHLGVMEEEDSAWVASALREALPGTARALHTSLIVLKDFPSSYRDLLSPYLRDGFTRVPSMPMTRLELQFKDFDDYLRYLSYGTRKSLRRKFRKADAAAKIECKVVSDVSPYLEEVYPLYLAVHERSPMQFEKLSKATLAALGQSMPERWRFFLWRLDGGIVAFSICLVHEDAIYDEYLGLDYRVAHDLHLYFYTLRDILQWALAHGLRWYWSSPLNYDPKLHLGFQLAPLDLYVRHVTPWLNPFFGQITKFLGPTRHDPVLPKFANANEL